MTSNIIELTRFRADLTRALTRSGERLLNAQDQAAQVSALEPLEAYFIARELGFDQARPLLLHMTEGQIQACIDLTCWHSHDFQPVALAEWLAVFADEGAITLAQTFFALDSEVQIIFLGKTLVVYSFEDDQIPDPEDDLEEKIRAMTPDSLYLLEIKIDDPMPINVLGLVGALYQHDADEAHHLIAAVRWEMQSQIEENALRIRSGRMHEFGFIAPDEAAILFSPPKKQPPSRALEPEQCAVTRLPALYAQVLGESNLLVQAMARITDQAYLSRLEQELVWSINTAIIAYGETPKDIEYVADIAMRVRDTISLGMEALLTKEVSGRQGDIVIDATQAGDLIKTWSMQDLFRHGYAATAILRSEVQQALSLSLVHDWYSMMEMDQSDEPGDRLDRAFISALLARHPLVGGFDQANEERVRAFASLADIASAQARLKRLIARLSS
ncbi:MAG: hypothetical protein KKD63_10555 [Proteobacteria bacterium]|nr:hypothetical protein [Desulfobulbaceae bacterium]MBU4153310.1 hypothetical protein [Pseudomonadota bacterium]